MKGDIDIFLLGLLVGLIIIVASYMAIMIHGVSINTGRPSEVINTSQPETQEMLEFPSSGLVGESPEPAVIKKDFGVFNVSQLDTFNYYGNISDRVENGLIYGHHDITFAVRIPEKEVVSAWVSFDVKSTNRYGRLIVGANNCTLTDVVLYPGHYEYPVPLSCLSNETVVYIHPRSSGWRLWAPDYYEIAGASLKAGMYYSKPAVLRFSLNRTQYKNFQQANLMLNFMYYQGKIRITVNGREIFDGRADDQMIFTIYPEDVRAGENEIRIFAEKNSEAKGRAELEVMYSEIQPHKTQYDFYVDGKTMDALKDGGYVSFYVSKIYRNGGISLKIYDRTGKEVFSKYLDLKTGLYNVPISSADVKYGRNTVELSAVDGGLFETTGIQVIG